MTAPQDGPLPGHDQASVVDEVTFSDRTFDFSRLASLLAGAFFVLLGVLVLLDTGVGEFPDQPLSETFGFTQTPLLGVINVVFGILLLAGASDWDRSVTTFAAALMAIGGLVVVFGDERLPEALRTDTAYGATLLLVGAALLVIAAAVPTVRSRRRVEQSSVR